MEKLQQTVNMQTYGQSPGKEIISYQEEAANLRYEQTEDKLGHIPDVFFKMFPSWLTWNILGFLFVKLFIIVSVSTQWTSLK